MIAQYLSILFKKLLKKLLKQRLNF